MACWAKPEQDEEAEAKAEGSSAESPAEAGQVVQCEDRQAEKPGSGLGGAEAPEFVPFSMMRRPLEDSALRPLRQRQRKTGKRTGRATHAAGAGGPGTDAAVGSRAEGQEGYSELMATTVMVSGVPPKSTTESFMMQLDSWGLVGTYDFVYMPTDEQSGLSSGYIFINFIDPAFVLLFCWIYHECQFQGAVTPAEVQGYEACRAHWEQNLAPAAAEDPMAARPVFLPNPSPSQWSVNTVNAMLSPQFREQFRKTKMCVFHRKNRCEMGTGCPFAHSQEELQPAPDLAKTKLCYNFFRGRCSDSRCKFAHGSQELRSVWVPYSPGVWFFGSGDEGSRCYAPVEIDLQGMPTGAVAGYPIMEQHLHCFLNGGEPCVPLLGELPPFVQDAASTPLDDARSESSAVFSAGGLSRTLSEQQQPPVGLLVGGPPVCSEPPPAPRPAPCGQQQSPMGDSIALRVRGTFMEAMQLSEPELGGLQKRSWSEADLQSLRAAMEDADL